jgi:hypothetical protein
MKIVKLDRRHKFYRENDMRHALAFDTKDGWPNNIPYESWLRERYGHYWSSDVWIGGWPTMYGYRKYYVAVKDPAVLTMMMLALGKIE